MAGNKIRIVLQQSKMDVKSLGLIILSCFYTSKNVLNEKVKVGASKRAQQTRALVARLTTQA